MEKVQRPGDPDELRNYVGEVHDHQHQHQDERESQPEFFTNQVAQALARDHTHPRIHLLNDGECDGNGNHHPKQVVTELRACLGIGEDSTRIVIDIGCNKSGAKNGRKQ
jgi:hypothetical protein